MDDLSKLKLKRGHIKGQLTRAKTFLNSLDLENLSDDDIQELIVRLERLEPILSQFEDIQYEIEYFIACQNKSLDSEINERDEFENSFYETLSKYKKFANLNSALSSRGSVKSKSNININQYKSGNNAIFPRPSFIKLPDVKPPSFNGTFERWLEFRDAFNSMVHDNANIPPIQKFYYLKSLLSDEPLELITSIEVCSDNYEVAYSLLTERYENKKCIVHNYIKTIFDMPILTKECYTSLRHLYDTFTKNLRSLKTLGLPTDQWDCMLIYLLTTKFDNTTRRDWESHINKLTTGELPSMIEMSNFLKSKCELLERLNLTKSEQKIEHNKFKTNPKFQFNKHKQEYNNIRSFSTMTKERRPNKMSCYFCKQRHSIYQCETFKNLDIDSRINKVKELNLCTNCFNPSHTSQACEKTNCRICSKKHNTMIHKEESISIACINVNPGIEQCSHEHDIAKSNTLVGHTMDKGYAYTSQVLLSTAIIKLFNDQGDILYVRALLDPGSQSHFITERLVSKLGIRKQFINYAITGIGETSTISANSKVNIKFGSRLNHYNETISCLVIPRITQSLPIFSFDISSCSIPSNIDLADPSFNVSSDIDVLLGVGVFYKLLLMKQIKLPNMLILQNSVLGYIISGELVSYINGDRANVISCLSIDRSLEENLVKFWKVEECNTSIKQKNNFCEQYFLDTYKRNHDGHFIVKIPFKENVAELGQSKEIALKRFSMLEQRLEKNPTLKADYCNFMQEYQMLGHMSKVADYNLNQDDKTSYFLPHHAVIKESSLTTRVRVVFDASAKPNSGLSLNQIQHVGPIIQDDLFAIILRFRSYKFVINADISKMYRQVLIDPSERRFQRIFWRENTDEPIQCFELNTVTYGTASAPFLAVRSLQQLGIDNKNNFPLASKVILNDFYMDDMLTGSDDIDEINELYRDVSMILASGGFELRKWLSNEPQITKLFSINDKLNANMLSLGEHEANKTLGIYWNARIDVIQYSIRKFDNERSITKRIILSITSQIFDPLGLLQPLIITAKIMLQQLWLENLGWDQEVPSYIKQEWLNFCNDLKRVIAINIPRFVLSNMYDTVELHGFADASEKAYGACIYVCCVSNDKFVSSRLLCAKSRVAPLKSKITLPRLELCAAVLLTNLMNTVIRSLQISISQCFYYSDSTITLYWIKGCPSRWKTFVANRVATILEHSHLDQWFHVNSNNNPADLISRGTNASNLINCKLYWQGPEFLLNRETINLQYLPIINNDDIPEQKTLAHTILEQPGLYFENFSSIYRLQRVIAYCYRFVYNLSNKAQRNFDSLSALEMQNSLNKILRLSQVQSFSQDYSDLKNKRPLRRSSKLLSLNPFIDELGLLRVGGRLEKANISFNKKHPIILGSKHHITTLLMTQEHLRLMHCGAQQLLYSIREKYWPISGRKVARTITKRCVICFKAKPVTSQYLMGHLPEARVNKYIPFSHTGLDYAGPVMLKDRMTRHPKLIKGYICIFICLSTRCMHLELVTSLTTNSFIAMLRRFISRRGKPSHIYSDNATTFVGADKEMRKFLQSNNHSINDDLSSQGITWHFIPPRAPNFGGIWEANIKQIKYHLKRILGDNLLTYEDYCTVLVQIEGILNSRPISPLSSDPNDPNPLTPAHFLMGKSITSIPDPEVIQISQNRLQHYERLQRIIQQFWRRWSKEYVGNMQTRLKWKTHSSSGLKIGSLIIIKEDNLPVFHWKVGRVTALHPGTDQFTRVATVKCSDGSVVKRALSKLCILPID